MLHKLEVKFAILEPTTSLVAHLVNNHMEVSGWQYNSILLYCKYLLWDVNYIIKHIHKQRQGEWLSQIGETIVIQFICRSY